MQASYRRIDLRQHAAGFGLADLDSALSALCAIYADVDARNASNVANLALPCDRGCDACCKEAVFLTLLEFYAVWDWAQNALPEATLQEVVSKGLGLYRQHEAAIVALSKPPPSGQRDHWAIAKDLRFDCPLLGDDGACRVYPARELLARLFGCSFNPQGGIYGCELVGQHLAGRRVTLLPAQPTARRLRDLPLTQCRQVYPFYIHLLYG